MPEASCCSRALSRLKLESVPLRTQEESQPEWPEAGDADMRAVCACLSGCLCPPLHEDAPDLRGMEVRLC